MSLIGRWINLIYTVAIGSWKVKRILAPIVAVLFAVLIYVCITISFLVDRWLNFPEAVSYPLSQIIGGILIAFGIVVWFLSIASFLEVGGTPVPFSPPSTLVTSGPYRFARNPMLTGIFIFLFGLGIFLGSLSLIFIFTPLFIIINVWELKNVEEPELERRLGKDYVNYKKRVPMFFPFIPKRYRKR